MSTLRSKLGRLAATTAAAGAMSIAGAQAASAANVTSIAPTSGGSNTNFNLTLPVGAKCSGDTATGNYETFSYFLDDKTLPASQLPTLTFNPNRANQGFSLIDTAGNPYEANAVGPVTGTVNGLPAFSFAPYAGDFGPGLDLVYGDTYNAGIACVTKTGAIDADNFWNFQVVFAPSSTDPGGFTWTASIPSNPTPEVPMAALLPLAGVGMIGVGAIVARRRRQSASVVA